MARFDAGLEAQRPDSGDHTDPPPGLPALALLGTGDRQPGGPTPQRGLVRVPPQGFGHSIVRDVQPQADGPELDVVLMKREAMDQGSTPNPPGPRKLIELLPEHAA